jgi:capsular polysaccharide biosynthesis protein
MELRRVLIVMLRRWWLVVGVPIVVLLGTVIASSSQPYVATIRAEVLLPGDTEETGDAEKPELMIMDDAPIVVTSPAFVDLAYAQLDTPLGGGTTLTEDDVQDSLSATRYSRILEIEVSRDDPESALAIGQAVANVLPDAINSLMVHPGEPSATVNMLEIPEEALQDAESRRLLLVVQTLVALAVGCGLAALAAALDERVYPENAVMTLGLPVLADVRASKRRWYEFWVPRGGAA